MTFSINKVRLSARLLSSVALIVSGALVGCGDGASEKAREASPDAASRMRQVDGPLNQEAAVTLDAATEARAGLAMSVVQSAVPSGPNVGVSIGAGVNGSVDVVELTGELALDSRGVTTLQAPVAGRLTSPSSHWPTLGERVAAGTVVAQVSDARPLVLPRSGTVTRVSAQPGQLVQPGQELLQLTNFHDMLARVTWRPEARGVPPRTLTIWPLSGARNGATAPSATATLVGGAAQVDSVTRAPVYLFRLSTPWPGAQPGAPVRTLVPASAVSTARRGSTARAGIVPLSAVVQWEGLAWAYVRHSARAAPGREGTKPGANIAQFVRRRVDTSRPVAGGFLIGTPDLLSVHVGDTVVVRGAQMLLSEEFRSSLNAGEAD